MPGSTPGGSSAVKSHSLKCSCATCDVRRTMLICAGALVAPAFSSAGTWRPEADSFPEDHLESLTLVIGASVEQRARRQVTCSVLSPTGGRVLICGAATLRSVLSP